MNTARFSCLEKRADVQTLLTAAHLLLPRCDNIHDLVVFVSCLLLVSRREVVATAVHCILTSTESPLQCTCELVESLLAHLRARFRESEI